jgi:hypothetical protein
LTVVKSCALPIFGVLPPIAPPPFLFFQHLLFRAAPRPCLSLLFNVYFYLVDL